MDSNEKIEEALRYFYTNQGCYPTDSSGVDLGSNRGDGVSEGEDACCYGDASCYPLPSGWDGPPESDEVKVTKTFVVTLEFEDGRTGRVTIKDNPGEEETVVLVAGLRHITKQSLETYITGGWTEKRAT